MVFLFPGQGAQYPGMGRELYRNYPVFRENFDACCEILTPLLQADLRELLFADDLNEEASAEILQNTFFTQPANSS